VTIPSGSPGRPPKFDLCPHCFKLHAAGELDLRALSARTAAAKRVGETPAPLLDGVREPDTELLQSERGRLVKKAVDAWTGQLIDLGGRNNLLFYRDLRAGTLDLSDAATRAVDDLLLSKSVALSRLIPQEDEHSAALKRVRTVHNKGLAHYEERGLETTFLACGLATWTNPKAGATPSAPILLRALSIVPSGAAQDDFHLALTGEMEVNPTLVHYLKTEFGIECNLDALLERMDGVIDTREELDEAFEWLKEEAGKVSGFDVAPRLVAGNFSYAKLPMVKDLEGSLEELIKHDLVAAIAGDEDAREHLRELHARAEASPDDPNRIPLGDEFLILDADASQNYAINSVLGGANLIVRGPPGTGKSQTIANLIATLTARGKKVLFVAEKRAAIDAVLHRLHDRGLSDLVLDLHGSTTKRKEIAEHLERSLQASATTPRQSKARQLSRLEARRAELNSYVEALHQVREPWGMSVFDAQVEVLGVDAVAQTEHRWRDDELAKLDAETFESATQALRDYVGLGGLTVDTSGSPWANSAITTTDEARRALGLARRLRDRTLPHTSGMLKRAAEETGLKPKQAIEGWSPVIELWREVAQTLASVSHDLYEEPLEDILEALAPATRSGLGRVAAAVFSGEFRRARSRVRSLATVEKPSDGALHDCVSAALAQERRWREYAGNGSVPEVPAGLDALAGAYEQLLLELKELGAFLGDDTRLIKSDEVELGRLLTGLVNDQATLTKLPRLHELRTQLLQTKLDDLLEDFRLRQLSADLCLESFRYAWLQSILEEMRFDDSNLGTFDSEHHTETVRDFGAGDSAHIESTVDRIRRAYAERVVEARNDQRQEEEIVRNQAKRKRGHLPIRSLFQAAPHVLLALKPCWAMSPLMVSQVLPSTERFFDTVIFDEASQVTPADAMPAILRAERVVVAGDERQLPPTSFFMAVAPDEEDQEHAEELMLSATSGFESILDVLGAVGLPFRMLTWHYRSQDERLIAFSNGHFYDRALTTFPGARGDRCVTHVLVPFRPGQPGQEDSVSAEVEKVVELILDHARDRPDESLGVIAMGIKHANRIEERLREVLQDHPELDEFFDEGREERFFVKNLERVQGDERDAIVLSVGYGKTAEGRLLYRFGPLLYEGGERRLNVAVTRAKRRMTLVSSFDASDMDPDRSSRPGVQALRHYLQYAASEGANLGEAAIEKPALNPFEIDVKNALTKAGIPVVPQWGCSGYWIDFVAKHPTKPGRLVLAIECDGASYHALPTARDRDRLRQEQLERLGWRFHRIWSTEWFNDRERAVARVVEAYREAVRAVDSNGDSMGFTEKTVPRPSAASASPPVAERPSRQGSRPGVPRFRPIDEYAHKQIVAIVRWIKSDTLLRTDAELLTEVMSELGFTKRGSKIVSRIQAAIQAVK
jgi:very-short-patch-repair endonuclease